MMAQTGFADVNGARLYYEIAGSGHPLVLVHAGIADSRMWDDQFAAFAQRYQVLRYDMRGFGKSPAVDGEYSHSEDLYALLTLLGMAPAYGVGCSRGGTTLMNLALAHPASLAAVVTVGSTPEGYIITAPPPPQWDEAEQAFKAGDLERVSELEVQVWVDGPRRTPDQVDSAIRDKVRAMNLIALQNEKLGLGNERKLSPPAVDRLGEIRSPFLALYGDLDMADLPEVTRFIITHIPGAQHAVISGTAHLPNMERPAEFDRIVLEFLGSVTP